MTGKTKQATSSPESGTVLVLSTSDRITYEVTRTLRGYVQVAFAESEAALPELLSRIDPRLIVLHVADAEEELQLPGRVLRTRPSTIVPLIALRDATPALPCYSPASRILSDVLFTEHERWPVLLLAWATLGPVAAARSKVLRVVHHAVPREHWDTFERLLLAPSSALSVKYWSSISGKERTRLYRELAPRGLQPRTVVAIARALHAIGDAHEAGLSETPSEQRRVPARTRKLLSARPLALSAAEIETAASVGWSRVHHLLVRRLNEYFAQVQQRPTG